MLKEHLIQTNQGRPTLTKERGEVSLGKWVGCSESVIVVSRALVADFELDLGAFSELFNSYLFCILTFNFSQEMEVRIELLRIVLVGVCTKLVVVNCCILPLLVGFDVKEFHE